MTSNIPVVSLENLSSRLTRGFRSDAQIPVILLGDAATVSDVLALSAFEVAKAGDRPLSLLPRDAVESDSLAFFSVSAADLVLASHALAVPHAAGSPVEIQRAQSVVSSLRALSTAERGVLAVTLSGQESVSDMNVVLGTLMENHPAAGVNLARTPLFWCAQDVSPLPSAYRNQCEVFEVEPRTPSPRRSGP